MSEQVSLIQEVEDWLKQEAQKQGRKSVHFPSTEWKKGSWRVADFNAREGSHFVVDLDPERKEVTLGFRTAGRYLNESIEQRIMDVADGSMAEFLEEGLDQVGLEGNYTMDHYRDEGEFCFTTTVPATSRQEISGLLQAYFVVFEPFV